MILKHLMEDPELEPQKSQLMVVVHFSHHARLGYCQGMTLVAAVFAAAAADPEVAVLLGCSLGS